MAELVIIYDPNQEMACIVNVDERMGWGPAMIGPRAAEILKAFLDTTPFDISQLDGYSARRAFDSFLEQAGLAAQMGETPDNQDATQPVSDTSMDNGNALAEAEAAAATSVPSEQPADTDEPETAPSAPTVVNCPNCNGSGSVTFEEGAAPQTCGMCQGSGKVTVGAPA